MWIASIALLAGCSGAGSAADDEASKAVKEGSAGRGTIEGVVRLDGPPPAMPQLDRGSDPACPQDELAAPWVRVGEGGTLRDVVVRLADGTPSDAEPGSPVQLSQSGCLFDPYVVAVMRGQEVVLTNADPTLHNARGTAQGRGQFNMTQVEGAAPITETIDTAAGQVVDLSCDVHPWMRAHIVVSDHPWFAVTGSDGAFRLESVPAGEHVLEAWHPHLGARTVEVRVADGQAVEIDFELAASKYQPPGH